jgi:hypothetical protein
LAWMVFALAVAWFAMLVVFHFTLEMPWSAVAVFSLFDVGLAVLCVALRKEARYWERVDAHR